MPPIPPGSSISIWPRQSESTPSPPSQYRPGPSHRLNQASRPSSLPLLPQPSHLLPTIRSPQRRHCASCQTWLWPRGAWSSDVPGAVGRTAAAWEQRGPLPHEGRGTHCGTSPIACPPTRLPVGEAVGWEVCPGPQDAPRQAGEVAEGSFPSPGGTHSSGRGSAGRLHHSPSWQLCPTPPRLPGTHRG